MSSKATKRSSRRICVTVSEFTDAGREKLAMELVSGRKGMGRRICEAAMNRTGLALTGFFQYFAHRRVQILGQAENTYLAALDEKERVARLQSLFQRHIPCLVVTRNRRILPEILALSEKHHIPVFRTPLITMYFVNAATIVMEELMAPRTTIQGTMVEIHGVGVLLEGKPGIGKSETALALIEKGHSLVADDVTALHVDSSGAVVGAAVGVTRYHMEIRGMGIIHVPSLFGVRSVSGEKRLEMIISLSDSREGMLEEQFTGATQTREVLGVQIPLVGVPVAPGRDLANLVEAAALDYRLKRLGHDAAKELDEKLKAVLAGDSYVSE